MRLLGMLPQWHDIASAPKDGTPILVWFGLYGAHRVFWSEEPNGPGIGSWCVTDNKREDMPLRRYREGEDTHWMPLPSLPSPPAPEAR